MPEFEDKTKVTKGAERQIIIHKVLHSRLNIEQHEHNKTRGMNSGSRE